MDPCGSRKKISTHALTEGDVAICDADGNEKISTHALTEGDCLVPYNDFEEKVFQLTPSRRATFRAKRWQILPKNFNSRPHGGRLQKVFDLLKKIISTHALTEGDRKVLFKETISEAFQLTPSRRATNCFVILHFLSSYFNSRPHGGRRRLEKSFFRCRTFQLTPSRRAT